jgi:hypothetical protein
MLTDLPMPHPTPPISIVQNNINCFARFDQNGIVPHKIFFMTSIAGNNDKTLSMKMNWMLHRVIFTVVDDPNFHRTTEFSRLISVEPYKIRHPIPMVFHLIKRTMPWLVLVSHPDAVNRKQHENHRNCS